MLNYFKQALNIPLIICCEISMSYKMLTIMLKVKTKIALLTSNYFGVILQSVIHCSPTEVNGCVLRNSSNNAVPLHIVAAVQ